MDVVIDMHLAPIGEAIVWGAAVVGAIVAIFRVAGTYILDPLSRRNAERDEERLDRKLAPLTDQLSRIQGEVTYNGGSSLKDGVRRLESRLTRLEGRFDEHDKFMRDVRDDSTDDA